MSRNALIDLIVEQNDVSKKDAENAIKMVTGAIEKAASKGTEINLIGFGKFTVKDVPERKSRNPQTGEEMTIAPTKALKFKVGQRLKDAAKTS